LDEERRLERLLILGVSVVGIVVVGVLGYGIVSERIIKPRQPVATVDETPIRTADFQARVKFRRLQLQNQIGYMYQQLQVLATQDTESGSQSFQDYVQGQINDLQSQLAPENAEAIGQQVLDQMIQEELVRQEAQRRDIAVSAEELQDSIHESFGYDPDATPAPSSSPPLTTTESLTMSQPTPAPTPTPMTEADFLEMYNGYIRDGLKPLGISEQQYRSWVEISLLTERLQEDMKEELPQEAEQIKLRYLSVGDQERAENLAQRLDSGEDFQTLADEVRSDEEMPGFSSELDWLPKDLLAMRLSEDLADLAFSLEVGEHTEPVTLGEEGRSHYIIEVTGHETRELEPSALDSMAREAFQAWLDAQQQSLVERKSWQNRVPMEP
jgi:parvulin-like peptidyl-prolyl isomerase